MKNHLRIFDNTQLRLGLLFSSNFCRRGMQGVPDEMAVQRRNPFQCDHHFRKETGDSQFQNVVLTLFHFHIVALVISNMSVVVPLVSPGKKRCFQSIVSSSSP